MNQVFGLISRWALPCLLIAIPVWGLCRRVRVYQAFVAGARDGLMTGIRIAPYLLAMLVAIGVFRGAGGIRLLVDFISPVLRPLGVPEAVIPLGLMRPLSGSGSLGILNDLLAAHGPDSPVGLTASVIQGSTETTFYVLTIYLGSVGLLRLRHTWLAGLAADITGFLVAVAVARLFF
ncbi:MAG: spore maturation protein [Bacteroidota bacterium]